MRGKYLTSNIFLWGTTQNLFDVWPVDFSGCSHLFGVKLLIKKGGDPEENKVPLIQEQAETIVSNPSIISDVSENQIVEEITKKKETDPQLGLFRA